MAGLSIVCMGKGLFRMVAVFMGLLLTFHGSRLMIYVLYCYVMPPHPNYKILRRAYMPSCTTNRTKYRSKEKRSPYQKKS